MNDDLPVDGVCPERFGSLKDAFVENFRVQGEVGARLAVLRDGETIVDLRGGYTTSARDVRWDERTLVCCMSVSKGVTALAAHLLADRGLLDVDAPVARYWPEFAQGGKQAITVRQAMSHRASLGIIDSAQPGDMFDWAVFTAKIAAQPPNWTPGTHETYHSLTYGFIVGEIVRRVDGRPIDRFIADELAGPLRADFLLGCPESDLARVVPGIPNPLNQLMSGGLLNQRTLPLFNGSPADPGFAATPAWLRAVNPSGGGVSNALGIARLFSPLATAGVHGGKRLFSPRTLAIACEQQWHHNDSMFGNEFRVALGLLLHCGFSYFGREGNVGSAGAGGYTVFADPVNRIAFGYTPNRFTSGGGLGDESRRLVDALYRCL